MIRIVTDSTCDVPQEVLTRHRITLVPINIQFGQESFQEGVTMDGEAFYRKVEATSQIPTTSQPSLGQFQAAYGALAAEPDTEGILSLHITGHLSGTHGAAIVAAQQMPAEPPITVFDSLSGSMGLGYMVLEAAQMAEARESLAAILARLEALRSDMKIFFSLEDLRYARMSGRVGLARALLVSVLNIKLMLTVTEGRLVLLERVRSRPRALQALVEAMAQALHDRAGHIAVIHAQAAAAAEDVRRAIATRLPGSQVMVRPLSIGIAVHFGPGTVGLVGYVP
jgi:DegV family protein with EDD domain